MIQHLINTKENMYEKVIENKGNIVNMKEYKKNMLDKENEKKLLKSEDNIEKGRVKDASKVFQEWKLKYGI